MSECGSESSWEGCSSSSGDVFDDPKTPNSEHTDFQLGSPSSDDERFTLFGKVAAEIRCIIWTASIEPRLVHWRPGCQPPAIMRRWKSCPRRDVNVLVLIITLDANQESREIAKRHYIVCFEMLN